MAVEKKIAIGRRDTRRNVLEMKPQPTKAQIERQRPIGAGVAISVDHSKHRTEVRERLQEGRITHVAEVPDFIGVGDGTDDVRG